MPLRGASDASQREGANGAEAAQWRDVQDTALGWAVVWLALLCSNSDPLCVKRVPS